jgi:hypothetical protein
MDETPATPAAGPPTAGPGEAEPPPWQRRAKTIVVLRSIVVLLLVALAIASFAGGRVLIGVLFTGLAATNVALITMFVRRRNELGERVAARRQRAGA